MLSYNPALNHPYGLSTIKSKTRKRGKTMTRVSKKQKKINDTKKSAPGVPTNTCPYIDHAIAIIEELQDMHDELYQKGTKVPMFERKVDMLKNTLEYVRSANETLRDNSLYWYNSYKKEA